MEWLKPWAKKLFNAATVRDVSSLLEAFLDSNELIDYMREGMCDDCDERMPDEPSYNEGYI